MSELYDVNVWREATGGWSAEAIGLDGAFTAGDSLAEVERNIRESIAVTLDLSRSAERRMTVQLRVRIDDDTDDLVARTAEARAAAATAPVLTVRAVDALRDRGLSIRDIAAILGITAGRVGQIVSDGGTRLAGGAAAAR